MEYIKLEDVQKILERNKINHTNNKWETTLSISPNCIEEINSTPTINPEEMIQDIMDSFENEDIDIKIFARAWLKILIQKFKS